MNDIYPVPKVVVSGALFRTCAYVNLRIGVFAFYSTLVACDAHSDAIWLRKPGVAVEREFKAEVQL